METMLDSEEDIESSLSMSPTSDIGTRYHHCCADDRETSQGLSISEQLNHEESCGHSNFDLDLPSMEAKELETVFEDDVLSDSSSYRERSGSTCSIPPVIRDRSGSTWSTMTLCDRERSTSSVSGYRERSYSSTSVSHEPSLSGSAHRQRSYSISSDSRQRSASIGSSILPNPLQQSHRLSVQYMKSAFTFLNSKGKLSVVETLSPLNALPHTHTHTYSCSTQCSCFPIHAFLCFVSSQALLYYIAHGLLHSTILTLLSWAIVTNSLNMVAVW